MWARFPTPGARCAACAMLAGDCTRELLGGAVGRAAAEPWLACAGLRACPLRRVVRAGCSRSGEAGQGGWCGVWSSAVRTFEIVALECDQMRPRLVIATCVNLRPRLTNRCSVSFRKFWSSKWSLK